MHGAAACMPMRLKGHGVLPPHSLLAAADNAAAVNMVVLGAKQEERGQQTERRQRRRGEREKKSWRELTARRLLAFASILELCLLPSGQSRAEAAFIGPGTREVVLCPGSVGGTTAPAGEASVDFGKRSEASGLSVAKRQAVTFVPAGCASR